MLTIDPETKEILFNGERIERGDPRLWGSAGFLYNPNFQTASDEQGNLLNPQSNTNYWESYTEPGSEGGGGETRFRLTPEAAERLGGRVQVTSLNYGGAGEIIDPSLVTYDEEFGFLTDPSNIREPASSGVGGFLERYLPYMLAAGMGAAIAATGGLAGLGIAGAGEGAAAGVGEGIAGSGATTGGGGVIGGALEPIAASTIEAANPALASIEGIGASASPTIGASATPVAGIGGGASGLEVSETMRNILAQGTAAGGSAASTAANAAIQQGVQTLGGIGSGGILSSLSPISQRIITNAIGQGVSAISASRRQADAQRFAREQSDIAYQRRREEEERAAEERRIRGTPQAYTFNITPRSQTGIIGSGMGGG